MLFRVSGRNCQARHRHRPRCQTKYRGHFLLRRIEFTPEKLVIELDRPSDNIVCITLSMAISDFVQFGSALAITTKASERRSSSSIDWAIRATCGADSAINLASGGRVGNPRMTRNSELIRPHLLLLASTASSASA